MINATFNYNKELGTIAMCVDGHAGQAEKGHDLICSAASMLAYTISQYVHYVDKLGGIKVKPHIELEDGHMLVEVSPTEDYIAEVLNAFFVAEVGYSLLAQNYPQYVELNMFGKA